MKLYSIILLLFFQVSSCFQYIKVPNELEEGVKNPEYIDLQREMCSVASDNLKKFFGVVLYSDEIDYQVCKMISQSKYEEIQDNREIEKVYYSGHIKLKSKKSDIISFFIEYDRKNEIVLALGYSHRHTPKYEVALVKKDAEAIAKEFIQKYKLINTEGLYVNKYRTESGKSIISFISDLTGENINIEIEDGYNEITAFKKKTK